jgi:hypothetical protein
VGGGGWEERRGEERRGERRGEREEAGQGGHSCATGSGPWPAERRAHLRLLASGFQAPVQGLERFVVDVGGADVNLRPYTVVARTATSGRVWRK